MHRRIKRSIVNPLIILFLMNGCVNLIVKEDAIAATPDLQSTAAAMLEGAGEGEELSTMERVEKIKPQATATIAPAPTATRYIPEGELAYFNFEEIKQGTEKEIHEGITLRKPEPFGVEIVLERDMDYHLAMGVVGHPDGNISTYVLNVTPPAETTAYVSCRVEMGENPNEDFKQTTISGYRAEFRFDGRARMMKRVNGKDSVLSDWTRVTSMNEGWTYDQLYLLCDGPRLLFMVNATPVFDLQDSELTEGDFAVGLAKNPNGGETVIRFDKVAVFEP